MWVGMASVVELREKLLAIDYERAAGAIEAFIAEKVSESGARGVVIGLSGGVDSSVTATLCVRALGSERVLGLVMPTGFTPKQDVEDAEWLANWLGIRWRKIMIDPIVETFAAQMGRNAQSPELKIPFANLRARIRMALLYFHANEENLIVVGTGDRSEALIGYYTKYGDGGVDLLPIGGLYKSQVRRLAVHLGIPERIAFKPSSPQLYPGHRAVDEIPLDYDILDVVLALLFDERRDIDEASREAGVPRKVVERVLEMHNRSQHKRSMPPIAPIS